jgi:HEAT repeat protein
MDNSRVRQQVLFALSHTREPGAVTILSNVAATDPDTEVRRQAAFWLVENRSAETGQAVERLFQKK